MSHIFTIQCIVPHILRHGSFLAKRDLSIKCSLTLFLRIENCSVVYLKGMLVMSSYWSVHHVKWLVAMSISCCVEHDVASCSVSCATRFLGLEEMRYIVVAGKNNRLMNTHKGGFRFYGFAVAMLVQHHNNDMLLSGSSRVAEMPLMNGQPL